MGAWLTPKNAPPLPTCVSVTTPNMVVLRQRVWVGIIMGYPKIGARYDAGRRAWTLTITPSPCGLSCQIWLPLIKRFERTCPPISATCPWLCSTSPVFRGRPDQAYSLPKVFRNIDSWNRILFVLGQMHFLSSSRERINNCTVDSQKYAQLVIIRRHA